MRLQPWLSAGTFALLGLTGCPLTDDYFIDAGQAGGTGGAALSGSGGVIAQSSASAPPGGSGSLHGGGEAALGATGGSALGSPQGGDATAGGDATTGGTCMPNTERCNGYDDNCNDQVDEDACDSALGCTGFTLNLDPEHGYMFCSGHKNWAQAQTACAAQDMRLASVETSDEGGELAQTLGDLTAEDTWFGANDQAVEGQWVWDGGAQFWEGNQTGSPVGEAFVAWANGSPDNSGNGEDCAVMNPNTEAWADRSCAGAHAYVCEDATP